MPGEYWRKKEIFPVSFSYQALAVRSLCDTGFGHITSPAPGSWIVQQPAVPSEQLPLAPSKVDFQQNPLVQLHHPVKRTLLCQHILGFSLEGKEYSSASIALEEVAFPDS